MKFHRRKMGGAAGGIVLPNFLVIGAMKAGTVSLYHYLRAHPQIFMSQKKELDFFVADNDANHSTMKGHWELGSEWYEQYFQDTGQAAAIGEASTSYTKYPRLQGVPERVAQLLPTVRLIYLLRDPISRIRSHYLHERVAGRERRFFQKAVRSDTRYIDFSRYSMQIDQYLEYFPRSQLLVLTLDDLRDDPAGSMRRTYEFLGVDCNWTDQTLGKLFHASSEKVGPRGLAVGARQIPGYGAVTRIAPERLKRYIGDSRIGA